MKKMCLLFLILLILLYTGCNIFAATDDDFVLKTIKGKIRNFGTEPRIIYAFMEEGNRNL